MNTHPKKQLALIIDDTEVVRSLLSEALSERGFDVVTAQNASAGIEQTITHRPSIVFCDTYMPDMDGFETIRRIREISPESVVVMTNSLPDNETQKRHDAGADFLLNKPFGLDELWEIMGKIRTKLDALKD